MPQPDAIIQHLRKNLTLTLDELRLMFKPEALRAVRVCDLREVSDDVRLEHALALSGAAFDAEVLAVLREAGDAVAAGYLSARVGGPRWKLQASLGRLVRAGLVTRRGATSDTRYRAVGQTGARA